MPLAERLSAALAVGILAFAALTLGRVFACRTGLASECALVNLKLDSRDKTDVGGNPVANGKGYEVTGHELVCQRREGLASTDTSTVS